MQHASISILALRLSIVPFFLLQLGKTEEATSSAHTYLYFNPSEPSGRSNVEYYDSLDTGKTKTKRTIAGNPLPHVNAVQAGLDAYNAKNFAEAAELFETAISLYSIAMDTCFGHCENNQSFPVPQTGHFAYDLALNYRNLLRCQLECPGRLQQIGGTNWDSLWPQLYDFLQFSYFKGWLSQL